MSLFFVIVSVLSNFKNLVFVDFFSSEKRLKRCTNETNKKINKKMNDMITVVCYVSILFFFCSNQKRIFIFFFTQKLIQINKKCKNFFHYHFIINFFPRNSYFYACALFLFYNFTYIIWFVYIRKETAYARKWLRDCTPQ